MRTRAQRLTHLEAAADKLSLAKDTMDGAKIAQARMIFTLALVDLERSAYDLGVDMGERDLPERDRAERLEETFGVYTGTRLAIL